MASSNQDTKKRLALAIIDFLNTSLTDGTLPSDERDQIEVATSCISDAFKVNPEDKAAAADAVSPGQNLLSIYSVYEKLRTKTSAPASGSASAAEARPSTPSTSSASSASSDMKNAEAENLKNQGNVAMKAKDYTSAIDFYTRAIAVAPTNPIFLSNRAAAYSATQQHDLARQDAELAVAADPKYTKAWSRLGLAKFALGDAKGSMEAYKSGIDAEGNGGSDAMRKGYETAKRRAEEQGANADAEDDEDDDIMNTSRAGAGAGAGGMPDLSSLAGMFGGGGGGGGGMPDLSALMNNPTMRQMAQNMMSNPDMMNNLMSNPRIREMAASFGGGGGAGRGAGGGGGGGGMPDLSSLMNDPSIAEMARSFMGGGGAGGAGAGRGSGR